METTPLNVSEAIALINQTLEYAYPTIVVEGEVSSFKINQQKFVFFDLKDATGTLGCFMMVFQLRTPIEDGMTIRVVAQPKLTQWGKFSLTVRDIQPVGEGSLKRSFELLRAKLDREGLFDAARKRRLPPIPAHIAVVTSTQSAGYADFIKILQERWGGVAVKVAHTAVQGMDAPRQIVRAIEYCNQLSDLPDVIAVIRGGGSLDDLSAFNDEPLVRAIAASRIPIITGIGHEVDTSLADMAADVRAATPSNVAQIIVPDRREIIAQIDRKLVGIVDRMEIGLAAVDVRVDEYMRAQLSRIEQRLQRLTQHVDMRRAVLKQLDPRQALRRGYALMFNEAGEIIHAPRTGDIVTIETKTRIVTAGVTHVSKR